MRDIKFRGKRVDNGEWVYGGFHKHQKITPSPITFNGDKPEEIEYAYLIIESGFSDWNLPKPLWAHEIIPETVSQNTGLQDCNGRDIFEGDILRTDLSRPFLIVEFRNGCFVFKCHDNGQDYNDLMLPLESNEKYLNLKVIGNISDNPDLLQRKD